MNARPAITILAVATGVLAALAVAAFVAFGHVQLALMTTNGYQPGGDPGFLEYQRLAALSQLLYQTAPWLTAAAYLPAIAALALAASRVRTRSAAAPERKPRPTSGEAA